MTVEYAILSYDRNFGKGEGVTKAHTLKLLETTKENRLYEM
jgi:hypothetical protein